MRLIGFGLLAFLLAGVALLISNSQSIRLSAIAVSEVALGPRLIFETQAEPATPQNGKAVVHWARPNTPLILSGLPAYHGATFYMPLDARPASGYLQIDATIQVLTGVEGILRVSIGNVKRAELLLHPGQAGRSLRIPLTEQELARERLVVSFSLQGEGPHTPCGIDEAVEAVVEIETTSAIFLQLEGDLETDRDRILTAGRSVTLARSSDQDIQSILAARSMILAGVDPFFKKRGLKPKRSEKAATQLAGNTSLPQFPWSHVLKEDAPIFGVRRFYRSRVWRLEYSMNGVEDPRIPESLELSMMLGQLTLEANWYVTVTLNGRLIEDRFVKSGVVELSLPLSQKAHRLNNVIEISASAHQNKTGVCDRGPEILAEILSETTLIAGAHSYRDSSTHVMDALKQGWRLADTELSNAEATIAAHLLAILPDPNAALDDKSPRIQVLQRGTDLAEWFQLPGYWLAYFDENGLLYVCPLQDGEKSTTTEVSLLINLGEAGT